MSTLTPAQEEFLRLMDQMGWSDAQTAQRLDVSRAAISQIRSGKNNPKTTLERLRLLASGDSGQKSGAGQIPAADRSAAIAELRWRLEYLSRHDRQAYDTISSLINTLYDRAKPANSTPDDVARTALAQGVAGLAAHRPVVFGRSRGAASPSAKTSAPKTGGPKH